MAKERQGSIKFDEDRKVFIVRVTYHDEQGKRRDIRRQAKTKTDANIELKKLKRDLDDHGGRILDGSRLIFNELADIYADKKLVEPVYKGETRISGLRSWKHQRGQLKNLCAYFGKQRIQSITHADIESYRSVRLQTKTIYGAERTITGVNRELALLRVILNFARRQGWIVRNPFEMGESLISLADENRRDRLLTAEEEMRLLAVCDGPRAHIRALIIAAVDTAMRKGELLKLKWSDMDFDRDLIRVRKTTTKTWEGRTIGITSRLRAELQRLWEQGTGNIDELMFGLKDNFKRSFATACRLAAIENLHFHDLRHTSTTRMIQSGMEPMEVMKITGHRQMSTFLRYLNVDHRTARRAAEALNNFYDKTAAEERVELIN
jgi:integrase